MKPIKMNYRHSLRTMNYQLERHNEIIYREWGLYHVIKRLTVWGEKEEIMIFQCSKKSDLANYINKKNGFN